MQEDSDLLLDEELLGLIDEELSLHEEQQR